MKILKGLIFLLFSLASFTACTDKSNDPTNSDPNDPSIDVVLNEIANDNQGPNDGDFIELYNKASSNITFAAGTLYLYDDKGIDDSDAYSNASSLTITSNGFLLFEKEVGPTEKQFKFGIGKGDTIGFSFVSSEGGKPVEIDSHTMIDGDTRPVEGRVPDGTGAFTSTTSNTHGTANSALD